MISLLRLLREHPDAVEADLSRYHQLDLRGLLAVPQTLTRRQVIVRLRHLPEDSAVKVALRGNDWTREHQLLDQIRMQTAASGGAPVENIEPHPASPAHASKRRLSGALESALARTQRRAAEHAARRTPAKEVT